TFCARNGTVRSSGFRCWDGTGFIGACFGNGGRTRMLRIFAASAFRSCLLFLFPKHGFLFYVLRRWLLLPLHSCFIAGLLNSLKDLAHRYPRGMVLDRSALFFETHRRLSDT